MKNEEMARLFSEATPYIQKYHGRTMVIKYGGNAMINETLKNAVMNDLVTQRDAQEGGRREPLCKRSAGDGRCYHGDRAAGAGR